MNEILIKEAKLYHEFNEEVKGIFDLTQELLNLKSSTNYKNVIETIFELAQKVEDAQDVPDEQRNISEMEQIQLVNSKALRTIEDIVIYAGSKPDRLCPFSMVLRQQDKDNKFSLNLLTGQVKPIGLVQIIMSNTCDEAGNLTSNKWYRIQKPDAGTLQFEPKKEKMAILGQGLEHD